MLLALALTVSAALVPHTELPSTFSGDRVFVMPRAEDSQRRLALWVDSDGSGFIRRALVDEFHLQTATRKFGVVTYLPSLDERDFPSVSGDRGALPVLNDADVAGDPIFNGIDGQLGWSWLDDRIWTIDYVGHHLYWDHSAPEFRDADRVALSFDAGHRYPQIGVAIDGKTYRFALDTAASIALSPVAAATLGVEQSLVRATSFIPRATLDAWHSAHPEWSYIADGGAAKGVTLIRVPEVRAGRVAFHNVWFSTRPNDDVFENDPVQGKLGANAFSNCALTIDYVHGQAGFECATQ